MFDINQLKIDIKRGNSILLKHINLDAELDCFIIINTKESTIAEVLMTQILDIMIGNISKYNTYKDFSSCLESINYFLKTWQNDGKKIKSLDVFIGILNKSNLIFSTVWSPWGYLIKRDGELIEIIDKGEKQSEFSFISSGDINDGETLILSSMRLLDILSKTDIRESAELETSEEAWKNLEHILMGENIDENIGLISLKNNFFFASKEEKKTHIILQRLKNSFFKIGDNRMVKTAIAKTMHLYEQISKQGKRIKNSIFIAGILVSIIILYTIIGGVIGNTQTNKEITLSQQQLEEAREYIRIANENVANPDVFDLNIKKAEEIVYEIQEKQLFLTDIEKILDDISIIKKQFNGVESFSESQDNLINTAIPEDSIKILEINNKTYILWKNKVVGPIIAWQENPKQFVFENLEANDSFKEAVVMSDGTTIISTNWGKIVSFKQNGYFRYVDVLGQDVWEESVELDTFAQNIYFINNERNQIVKHKKVSDNFESWVNFLEDSDSKSIGNILSIAIDGGIYILKNDLSMIKAFNSPKYRLESLLINKLPKNYQIENTSAPIKLKTRGELSYVYLFLNEKIWVFKPNSTNYQDTKNLTYIGQIEGKMYDIKDFYVHRDGEIYILNENGIYQLNFEVSDNKLIIR